MNKISNNSVISFFFLFFPYYMLVLACGPLDTWLWTTSGSWTTD